MSLGAAQTLQIYKDSVFRLLQSTIARSNASNQDVPWAAFTDPELGAVSDSSLQLLDSLTHHLDPRRYDLPMPNPLHPRVIKALAYFTGPGRPHYQRYLNRRSRYQDLISSKLKARKMPQDLIYLAMVESGFNSKAWSRASASGIWQFISGTGRRYGLHDDWWIDHRRDPVKATDAALSYLWDLYSEFGDWNLAMAAYNCGEGRVRRHLKQNPSMTYWEMPLPAETQFYVPKILAATIIGHDPERYGFRTDTPEPAFVFDTASVEHCLAISTIAKAANSTEEEITVLNPELRRWCSPPNRAVHTLYLPQGSRAAFLENYARLDKSSLVRWQHHIVRRGENLASIGHRYRVSAAAIKAANKLRGNSVRRGQSLLIPLSSDAQVARELMQSAEEDRGQVSSRTVTRRIFVKHKVRRGETLYDVARRYKVSVAKIQAANRSGSRRLSKLRAGQVIRIPKETRLAMKSRGRSPGREEDYKVEPPIARAALQAPESGAADEPAGKADKADRADRTDKADGEDGAEKIARAEGTEAREDDREAGLREEGGKSRSADKPAAKKKESAGFATLRVQKKETLFSISQKVGVSVEDLRRWNGIRGNAIQAGQTLKYLKGGSSGGGRLDGREEGDDEVQLASFSGFKGEDGRIEAKGAGPKRFYVVRSGDSLWDISVRFGSSVEKLRELNGSLPVVLKPGIKIRVQ